ncbi:branched-chain amino acid transport system II carrier protein [Escherichia coli]
MTHQLRSRDIIALGFMTFALFVGAGNIRSSNGRLAGRRTRLDCGIRLPHYCRWPAGINGSGAGKSWRRC